MFPRKLFVSPARDSASRSSSYSLDRCAIHSSSRLKHATCALAILIAGVVAASTASAAQGKSTTTSLGAFDANRVKLADVPAAKRGAAIAEKDGVLFFTGGDARGVRRGRVETFDTATGVWTTLTDRIVPRSFGGAVVIDEWLVIVGGRSAVGAEPATELVHIKTGEVVLGASLPTPRWSAGVAIHDGLVFVAGGTHGWARLDVVEAYDIVEDEWLARPALNVARDAGLVDVDGTLYAVAGYAGPDAGATRLVEKFDGEQFVVVGALALPMSAFAIASVDSTIVLFGDFASPGRVVAFSPDSGATSVVRTKFVPRVQAAATAAADGIVVAGGREISGEASSVVEIFRLR